MRSRRYRVVAHFQHRVLHARRHDERDHLKDDVGGDHVIEDDEDGAVDLQQQLMRIAEEEAGHVDARRVLVGPDEFQHAGIGERADQEIAGQAGDILRLPTGSA
jgi:hypothetical protein